MWKFRPLTEGELERSPHEAEFFNVGDIDKAASLTREIIQNSLDARMPGHDSVHVRFIFGRHKKLDGDIYYDGLIPHIESCNLLPKRYLTEDNISFLTIEDFKTSGLNGPITRDEVKGGEGGNYYNFWWCEGKSQKAGTSAGRWGLGKIAFHVASDLRSFWGLTVRQNDRREVLLGKSLLKSHFYNGAMFDYYGYFAGDAYTPIEKRDILEEFHNKFALTRNGEPGLSIVIPMPSPEISCDAIIRSVIIHYFFPIMRGMLVVEVIDTGTAVLLNGSTLREIARNQDWRNSAWEDRAVDSLMEFLEDAVKMPEANIISLQMPVGTPRIREELFGNQLSEARKRFSENELVYIRVPVKIHPQGRPETDSYFEVLLRRDDSLSRPDEFYVRAGITISEIRKLGNRRVRALLSAHDEAVCTFLGDCESPAHTDWKERTEGFQEKYHGAMRTLRFIKSSMADILRILDQPPPGIERDFLRDVFFIPEDVEQLKPDDVTPSPPPPPPPAPRKFEIGRIAGGFRVTLSDKAVTLPLQVRVTVAYDIRRGNPFSHYHPMDFQLTSDVITKAVNGGTITETGNNHLQVTVNQHDFELRVTGFDQRRDLIVDIREV